MTQQELQERREAMYRLVEAYLSSGQNLLQFSKIHGIPKTTFQNWHKKYLKKGQQEKPTQRFMPIRISAPVNNPLTIELYYPNGICLKLSNLTDIGQVNQLISSYPYVKP